MAGVPEQIADGETGFLVDPLDVPAIAEALRKLVADPALRQALGTAARERFVKHFTLEKQVETVERIYDELVSGVTGAVER